MSDTEIKPLLILKASAGSGKTYRLVEEFLKIILNQENDTYYQSVLALTFTNKAAKEMKERIISALEVLSKNPDEPGFDSDFLTDKVNALGLGPDHIREKSKSCLNEMIHNYGNLSIMTIDKFSHKIVRAFARDLELESDFGIELNTDELRKEVIAEIIDSYGKDPKLSNILYSYSRSNIEEGSVWNVAQNILKFSKSLDSEKYDLELNNLKALSDEDFDRIRKELDAEVAKLEKSFEAQVERFIEFLESVSNDVQDYGNVGNGIYGNILRRKGKRPSDCLPILEGATLKKYYDNCDFGGKGAGASSVTAQSAKICEYIDEHDKFLLGQGGRYSTLKGIQKKFYNIRLIRNIQSTIDQLKENKNIKEIADLNKEISQIILSESVPFIYERIGERYRHFLLDEFQDTSVMQWQNLVPLVENGISANHHSLIVGDAKQSIYRFRNGEVEQFIKLPDLYNPKHSDTIESKRPFFRSMGIQDSLKENYRSRSEIVEFNNQFFTKFARNLAEEYQEIYQKDFEQHPVKGQGGYVKLEFREEFELEEKLDETLEVIKRCMSQGFEPKDICLIIRRKKEGVDLATSLEKANIPVISDESLYVGAEIEVQLAFTFLNLIEDPENYEVQSLFAERYLEAKKLDTNRLIHYQYKVEKVNYFKLTEFLVDHEIPDLKRFLSYDSLVELIYRIKQELQLQYENNPYLELFFEQIYKYEIQNSAYLKGFLDWWKDSGEEEAITIPESTNAIKIMTVHKSKGLQFPVVIVPFADWGFGDIGQSGKKDTLWVNRETGVLDTFCIETSSPEKELDAELKVILQHEKDQMILDETNNLYVAFTRPVERLYVFGEIVKVGKEKKLKEDKISSAIFSALDENLIFESGSEEYYDKSLKISDTEIGLDGEISGKQGVTFSFKPIYPNENIQHNIDFGIRLHKLMAKIEKHEDLEKIEHFLKHEEIDPETKLALKHAANSLFSNPEMKKLLFEDNIEVLSEHDLITETGKMLRPDRVLIKSDRVVVVDFKSGEPRPKDQKQIDQYVRILNAMGSKNVEGKLIYL
ncbi:MAG: UvrD-helicase domain-containing protein [Crocinitomicaceae bacterium]